MLGIALIDKPAEMTSHDVVSILRRRLGLRRIGHAGTLDPLATGLLVVAVGPATRFLQYLPLEPKVYEATFRFGQTTNTYDAEGEITEERPVPAALDAAIAIHLPSFRGSISQLPPAYSAVKKEGRPLYAYARAGIEVERTPRQVFIESFELLELGSETARFRIVCSGGTYIRTLAHDLGEAIGCGAHIHDLRRTHVGRFSVEQAIAPQAITPNDLLSLAESLPPLPLHALNEAQVDGLRQGREVRLRAIPGAERIGLLDPTGEVVGIGRTRGEWVQPECVIPGEAVHGQ